jgi:hypothetical protein
MYYAYVLDTLEEQLTLNYITGGLFKITIVMRIIIDI